MNSDADIATDLCNGPKVDGQQNLTGSFEVLLSLDDLC